MMTVPLCIMLNDSLGSSLELHDILTHIAGLVVSLMSVSIGLSAKKKKVCKKSTLSMILQI